MESPPRLRTTTTSGESATGSHSGTSAGSSQPVPAKRARGRPRIKEAVLGPKRPRGRPRKYQQEDESQDLRRPRGRPPNNVQNGGVRMAIVAGPIVMPSVESAAAQRMERSSVPNLRAEPEHGDVLQRAGAIADGSFGPPRRTQEPHRQMDQSTHRPDALHAHPTVNLASDLDIDPRHAVFIDDEPAEDGADGEGFGEEDYDEGDSGDEGDDEDDSASGGQAQSERPSPRSRARKPLPVHLQQWYDECLRKVEERDGDNLPRIYVDKTFWLEPPSSWFALQSDRLSPSTLYRRRIFVWDPQCLFKDLKCPGCGHTLHRHAAMSRPRRIADMSDSFYIMGFRYRCRHCPHPRTGKNTVTYRSWDRRILAKLPRALASQFPARLTHRSGVSLILFKWMRSCIQNGMGSKQFADAVRVQHLLRHDELQLDYVEQLTRRCLMSEWRDGDKYDNFLPYDDTSPHGPHGYVPSAQYFRDIYDDHLEEHRQAIEQHMAMCTAEICALDHSHKIVKHIATVNGQRVFTALLTVTNEKGEIRACCLVATKSHSQFELALVQIRRSLDIFGHKQPEIFYTDNMADKAFLESSFPSLRRNVVPIEKYGQGMEPFILPADVDICVRSEEQAINTALSTILEHVPMELSDPEITVGFDCEWNVSISDHGAQERGEIAIVQIAFQKRVYILQISDFISRRRLPEKLVMLLQNPRVLKVGRMVTADLKQLQEAIGSSTPFTGGLDLAAFAKARHVVADARSSLAQLCATVLQRQLSKNISERTSTRWEHRDLTNEQQVYAATDAYVPLMIYENLRKLSVPQPLTPDTTTPLTPLLIFSSDNTTIIARGRLPQHPPPSELEGIKITPTRVIVEIIEVLVPGAIVTSHHKRALNSFSIGAGPFMLVCTRSRVKVYDPLTYVDTPAGTNAPVLTLDAEYSQSAPLPARSDRPAEDAVQPGGPSGGGESAQLDDDDSSIADGAGTLLCESLGLDAAQAERERAGAEAPEASSVNDSTHPHDADVDSQVYGRQVFEDGQSSNPDEWSTTLRSRVLKDVFHVFNMLRLSATHGLRKEFGRALRDILFVIDNEDRARISAYLARLPIPKTFEQMTLSNPHWCWRHCRRHIPPPEVLYPLVKDLFLKWGPLKDASTKQPLFNQQAWKVSKQILELIRQGFVSDPPGIALYTILGYDKKADNLPIYRCSRGTNFTEGGVHTHLRARLPTSGVSIRHLVACLLDFVLQHNLKVGTFNSTGQAYRGHFDIWMTNTIQERLVFLEGILENPLNTRGVNGNLYLPTTERIGILPIPEDVRVSNGMAAFSVVGNPDQPRVAHSYLARMQGTRKAVLPIHTPEEYRLWLHLMETDPAFNSRTTGPVPKLASPVWNEHAEIKEKVFYKTSEQIQSFYKIWQTNLNIRQTLSMTASVRNPITTTARAASRSNAAPIISNRPLQQSYARSGLDFTSLRSYVSTRIPAIAGPSSTPTVSPPSPPTGSTDNHLITANYLARQRVEDDHAQRQATDHRVPGHQRRGRTCRKCKQGSDQPVCAGRKSVKLCSRPCKDCGRTTCVGRNPKKPSKSCSDGWD